MTIKELIEKLNQIEDKDREVAYEDQGYGIQYPSNVKELNKGDGGYYGGVERDCVILE